MIEEGNIVYFTPFYFPNGKSAPKPKYFVILKIIADQTVIASLPTSKNSIPSSIEIRDGCYEMPDINFNAFVFTAGTKVTTCNKSFDLDTFIYGFQIDYYSIPTMKDVYRIEGDDYKVIGKIKPNLYTELIDCLKNSKAVKKKFQRQL